MPREGLPSPRGGGGGGGQPVGMRSEEGAGGLGAALSARGPSWREKLAGPEVQFLRESQRREPAGPPASPFGDSGAGKPREDKRSALSKVVLRRLPPGLTKEQLEEQLRPLPAHDYFEVVAADLSLYPHLYSRAYINFRNPDDILLFRDRFDGYIFIGNKGLEYPAVVEFAPFQKIAKKKLKKKDAKTGSIEDDPEYKQFLESYSLEEERTSASPETLLGEIEAKTRELLARRTTPLLEYIKSRKLEKQRLREEKREERRKRELEKKRLREEEKRKRREEERCKRKEADKQKRAEKEVRIKLLKKLETGEEATTEKPKERSEAVGIGDEKQEARPVENAPETPGESPGCPGTLYVHLDGLEFPEIPCLCLLRAGIKGWILKLWPLYMFKKKKSKTSPLSYIPVLKLRFSTSFPSTVTFCMIIHHGEKNILRAHLLGFLQGFDSCLKSSNSRRERLSCDQVARHRKQQV